MRWVLSCLANSSLKSDQLLVQPNTCQNGKCMNGMVICIVLHVCALPGPGSCCGWYVVLRALHHEATRRQGYPLAEYSRFLVIFGAFMCGDFEPGMRHCRARPRAMP